MKSPKMQILLHYLDFAFYWHVNIINVLFSIIVRNFPVFDRLTLKGFSVFPISSSKYLLTHYPSLVWRKLSTLPVLYMKRLVF